MHNGFTMIQFAGIGLQLAQDELEQGGFPGAVRPDQADAVAAHDARGEIADDGLAAERLRNMLQLRHQLA